MSLNLNSLNLKIIDPVGLKCLVIRQDLKFLKFTKKSRKFRDFLVKQKAKNRP